jgi:hypothetical protein
MTYELINIMIPSYMRVEMLRECILSAVDTADHICFTVCVNHKDEATLKFLANFPFGKICAVVEKTTQPNLSYYYNKMYALTPWKNAVVSMIGDDMVFKTDHWDKKILNEFNVHHGNLILYCNDGSMMRDKMCVNLFTTRKIVTAQKKPFMCERYQADMIDFIWFLTGKYTDTIKYRDDIVIEHRHNSARPVDQRDETFQRLVKYQKRAKSDDEMKYAIMYASACAAHLLKNGIGVNPVSSGNQLFQRNTRFVKTGRFV